MMPFMDEYDLESGLHMRYDNVMDLLDARYLVPSYGECVALQGHPVLKERFESACRAWLLPADAKAQVLAFFMTWDGMVDTLVTFLERLMKQLHSHRQQHADLLQILIGR